ncbi:MAG: C39 family peptidase [Candidatus Eremiobacteraeota bacterium]|nr:C39 family peptidase [Candidatus Eremiobacteraeota bacterium]
MGVGDLNLAIVLSAALTIIRFASGRTADFTSDVHAAAQPFTSAVASWNVRTPAGSWIQTRLRVRIAQRFTQWYDMGYWSRTADGHHRHSVKPQDDADGSVDTDTLNLRSPADAWQVQVLVHAGDGGELPVLSLVAITTNESKIETQALSPESRASPAWGRELAVPERTQRVDESPDALAGGGDSWCSPTSVSMVMAYWAATLHHPQWDVAVPKAARDTYDPVYDGCGNWPFNVAFASEHGLAGWVERLPTLAAMDRYLLAGIPLVASIRVKPGELAGSPYPKTDGHLLVVRGFTSTGDVITNDPYALPGHIRIIYQREQFDHVWMGGSGGIVYVIAPPALLDRFGRR